MFLLIKHFIIQAFSNSFFLIVCVILSPVLLVSFCFQIRMLSKSTNWNILAQCDFFAVQNLVQTFDRPAMQTVEPMRESIFHRKVTKDQTWKETYSVIRSAYQNLSPTFQIKHDSYGGYRLVYKGNCVVNPPEIFRRNPVGFVSEIPDGATTNLSVMTSERTGRQLILLGPMRFVNSDCSPNCEYDFSSDAGIVQLRVKRRIRPGDELFVKYGPEFFETNACLCRTCEIAQTELVKINLVFDLLLESNLETLIKESIDEVKMESPLQKQTYAKEKQKRLRGRELVELFNERESSPLSVEGSPVLSRIFNNGFSQNFVSQDFSKILDADSESDSEDSSSTDNETDSECSEIVTISAVPHSPLVLSIANIQSTDSESIRGSPVSPVPVITFPSPMDINEQASDCILDMLFEGSLVSVENATTMTDFFCARFKLSDECSKTLHTLIKSFLPAQNNFPSAHSHVSKMKKLFENQVQHLTKAETHSLCVLKFRYQLRDIVQRNLSTILKYSEERKKYPHLDFNTNFLAPVNNNQNQIRISLLLFSDGVSVKKSTLKRGLWPVWLQIADLPPKLRMSCKNIVLASLFVGEKHPDWGALVPLLKAEIISGVDLCQSELRTHLSFQFKLLISDLGAKSHMLNMLKFNGHYGCHYCTVPGKTIGRTHAYYPYNQKGEIRVSSLNDMYVEYAETLGEKSVFNVVGVKGKSAFADIIPGLPLTAPVDYMHCVLLGVFPELMKLCYKSLSSEEKIKLNIVISGLACPREMIAYSRKVRSLDELTQFKANELFNWLFYLSHIFFLNRLQLNVFSHLTNLIFGVRLLFESSADGNTAPAEKFLDNFCREIVEIHSGNHRIETINVHCLRHLVDQVKRFGPLFCYSAMSFEAANRPLGDLFTGSHSECEVICRRVLQRHKLSAADIVDSNLRSIFCKLSGTIDEKNEKFDDEFFETNEIISWRQSYPKAKFFNRQDLKNVYFDSIAYKRSKHGNCYVSFEENNEETFGQIQFFVQLPGAVLSKVQAIVRVLSVLEHIGPIPGFYHRVAFTEREVLIDVDCLKKVLHLVDFSREQPQSMSAHYIVKLCSSFEHS